MVKIYYDSDVNLDILKNKKIGIIGYGSQGHAHALNLQDSGIDVRVGLREDSKTWPKAQEAGLRVVETSKAASESDIIMMLCPDQVAPEVYEKSIKPHLTKGKALVFAHGFNIHYKTIVPPKDVDVFMVAPKGPGRLVRSLYTQGSGTVCLFAIHQDFTLNAKNIALAYAKALGFTRIGAIETTFKEETETDLFGEQVVLCGGLIELIKKGFETLVEAGYQPEVAYFECLHEVKLIADLIHIGGISATNYSISDTAEWGEYCSGKRVVTDQTKKEMKKILSEIQDGSFAKKWTLEYKNGCPNFNKYRAEIANHPIEKIGDPIRKMIKLKERIKGNGTKQSITEKESKEKYENNELACPPLMH